MKQSIIAVLGVVLFVSSAVSAAMVPSVPYTGNPEGTSSGDILWSQLDEPTGAAFTDQAFEASYAAYDSSGADDFIVNGFLWKLESLFTPGSLTVAGANPFFVNVAFYADAGGLPGSVICDFAANTHFSSAGDGDLTIDVSGCEMSAQNAWFSQQVRQDFNPFGQHYWATRATAMGNPGLWKNPGDGFGNGCVTWQPANAVCGMTGEDWMFELSGSEVFVDGEGLPALGPFGAVLLIVSLGAGSAYVLRRRRSRKL